MSELPSVVRRFLRYVRYDTQSSEESSTYPSTEKQTIFLRALVGEMRGLGLVDAVLNERGYVTGTLTSNVNKDVPVIGLIAHVDTSPEVSGSDIKPQLHPNYDGKPLNINGALTLTPEESPLLSSHTGDTIITSDGQTLLGADDKAGVAEIMGLLEQLHTNPAIPHGTLKIAFTPDEEVGRGTETFNITEFGAQYAYTIDTGDLGTIENENFCADSVTVTFKGLNVHPGYAKDRLVSAVKAAARFLDLLPIQMSPETTEKRQGYIHPVSIQGEVENATVQLILRDFAESGIKKQHEILEQIAQTIRLVYPGILVSLTFKENYRNMKVVLDRHPQVIDRAFQAVRLSGLEPRLHYIRGGTDGARLCFMGLPAPNISAGGDLFHSRKEWIAVGDMQKAVEILRHLVQVWTK